jgi:hypothetical protein
MTSSESDRVGAPSPNPPVFFVRVANKRVRVDAASRASTFGELNTETQSAQRSEMGKDLDVRAPSKPTSTALPSRLRSGLTASRVNKAGCLKLKGEGKERVHPRVFCERVRKRLMAKGLGKHSFLKSAEEYENRGVNFVRFAAKSEKSEGVEIGRVEREWGWRDLNIKHYSTKVTDCQ